MGISQMLNRLSLFVVFSFLFQESTSSKILFFNGMGEGSHYLAASALAEELQLRGHSVTFLLGSPFSFRAEQPPHKHMFDFRIVHTNTTLEGWYTLATKEAFKGKIIFKDMEFMNSFTQNLASECQSVFNITVLDELRNDNFDLFVCDPALPCTIILGEYLGLEKVALIPSSLMAIFIRALGGTTSAAITAEQCFGYPSNMTFIQRLNNFAHYHFGDYFLDSFGEKTYTHIIEYMNNTGYGESLRKINLYIVASDPIFDQKIAVMSGHVQAAGLTIRQPKPLPQDLEEFMDSAGKYGVIIFSLGSYVTHMPDTFVELFQDAFSRLPQKVLWQWKNKDPPIHMPKNVKTMSWLPQMDLLGHNQTKLLFYQGGNNGIYEAIHYAVPVLVMPILADQLDVAQRVVEREIGLRTTVTELTSDIVVEYITTIMNDPKYKENVSRLSAIFRDRPQTPRERAAFMIEHILKFGSDHLRSPMYDLNFIQRNSLDMYLLLISCVICMLIFVYLILKIVLKLLVGDKAKLD